MPLIRPSCGGHCDAFRPGHLDPFAAIDCLARGEDLADHPAHNGAIRTLTQIRVQEIKAGGATEKSADAAIEMNQIHDPAIPGYIGGGAKIFEVNEIDVEAAGTVVLDHDIGLLKIARVKTGLMQSSEIGRAHV